MRYGLIVFGIVVVIAVIAVLAFIFAKNNVTDTPGMENSFTKISQDEAKKMMAKNDGHLIIDVRCPDEYAAGHIPGAICLPNESIGTEIPKELPDLDQVLLIYCRSGRRSKEAAQKLFDLGYTSVYEFGGIIDWTGEITTDTSAPETVVPTCVLVIEANGKRFYASLEDNASAAALIERLSTSPITVAMNDYHGFEKVGTLPWELERNDETITTQPGDIILYQGNQITLYYGENTWNFTRLARIDNTNREELLSILGQGDVNVVFSLEWNE